MQARELVRELEGLMASHGEDLEIHFGKVALLCHCADCRLFGSGCRLGAECLTCHPLKPSNSRTYRITGLVADPESVKPVEISQPATDPESATGVTLQPVDSTGGVT